MDILQTTDTSTIIETKLRKSEERLSLAMRSANNGLWDWNLITNEVYYSPRWKSMLGYEDYELNNSLDTWEMLVNPEDKDRVLKEVKKCIENGQEEFEVEMRMNHKDGSEIIILSRAFFVGRELDGQPIRLVGTHVDISERKKSEEFMKKTNSILEMIGVGKPASDVYNEIALMYESRHPGMRCSLLELENGKLLHGGAPSMPKEYTDAVHGLLIGPEVGSCGTSTYTGCQVLVENIETDLKWKNIKQYALPFGLKCCWSQPIINSKGKVLGAFGMYYNHPALPNEEESKDLISAARLTCIVMERDQLQKQIQGDQRLLEEQSKLASMGEMVGNIAHQWRQPLSAISTSATGAKLLKEINAFSDADFNDTMNNINASAQLLSQTIEDYRSFFDPKNNKLKIISSSKMIEKTLKLTSCQFEQENIQVIKNIEDINFESFENELIQVLLNLINNSKDAFNNLDNINNQNKLIFINIYKKENSLVLEFKDNAGGIKKDIMFRVFEPYFTTKYENHSTGIGLYMSQDIIEKHLSGNIKVENEVYTFSNDEYKGAKFNITLPLYKS